jgi:hypothetical membrane protein
MTTNLRQPPAKTALRSPGLWIMVGGIELLLLIHIAEFTYPGYSVSDNYISDMGVGPMPSSAIFAAAVILFGLMAITSAVLFRQSDRRSLIWVLLTLSGIGAIGVGAFNMDDFVWAHRASALAAFLFGNLAAIYSSKMVRAPVSFVFTILGLIGLSALALFGAGIYLGLGVGGMERMILYPSMFWAVGIWGVPVG